VDVDEIIRKALEEDIGDGDITTEIFVEMNIKFRGYFLSKESGIVCGVDFVKKVFKFLNPSSRFEVFKKDGDCIRKGDKIMVVYSNRTIFSGERTALNILQRLSGISTKTKKFVDIVSKYGVKIYATRKTTPNLRIMEKYAVRCGGGYTHRYGLYDAFMIKDNHIRTLGFDAIREKIKKAREKYPRYEIEIEAQSLNDVLKIIELDCDSIMLDNMSVYDIRKAIKIIREKRDDLVIEISGGVNEENIVEFAKLKPDRISIGSLTHSYKSLDISFEIERV
jgi:nicotinate-nucleotide pyrophosphorylase (carboxylating)